jgi:hypothetical protein
MSYLLQSWSLLPTLFPAHSPQRARLKAPEEVWCFAFSDFQNRRNQLSVRARSVNTLSAKWLVLFMNERTRKMMPLEICFVPILAEALSARTHYRRE